MSVSSNKMKKMNKQIQKAKQGFKIHQNIIETKHNITGNFIRLGYLLKLAQEEKLAQAMGYDTWAQYLATPEISISVSTASRLVNIWDILVLKHKFKTEGLTAIDMSKLFEILPVVRQLKSKNEVSDWLDKARELGMRDLRTEKISFQTGNDSATCKHDYEEIVYYRCRKCGDTCSIKPN